MLMYCILKPVSLPHVEADGDNNMPTLENLTCVSSQGGTALQFKKESGAAITGLSLSGYETNVDFRDGGATTKVTPSTRNSGGGCCL